MKKIKTYIVALLALSATLSSCKTTQEQPVEQQQAQIEGRLTRSGAGVAPTVQYNLGITAKLAGLNYLNNALATMAANTGKITFNQGPWYYPINKSTLQFYAYTTSTGAYANNIMNLAAGVGTANDALLSNNGGSGTPGSSVAQITQLEFSHLMTKLDVVVMTDDTELTGWNPTTFKFTMAGAVTTGQYNITSVAGTSSINNSTTQYTILRGTNYLVPTGATLANVMTSLVIDDYTASASDLTRFTIGQISGTSTSLTLNPGKAYVLTFKIRRLDVEQITLSLGNWTNVTLPNGNVGYTAQTLNLSFGNYASGDITKITILDNNDKLYTGSVVGSVASFVTAPSTVKSASIYTANGLLVKVDNGAVLAGNVLHLDNLNKYGMLPVEPLTAYDGVTNPYAISTVEQFKKIDGSQSYSYRQTSNVYMQDVLTPSIDMAGSFDGNGFQIHGINILGNGLFKEIKAGQIVKNVRISAGCVVQTGSESYIGGLCGKNSGTIVACVNEALVVSNVAKHMGGICGDNAGRIIGCMNAGEIKGVYGAGSSIGGICGYNIYDQDYAVVAALNVGMLRVSGTYQSGTVAGICGNSVAGGQFSTAYWLTGTAEPTIGTAEVGVNGTSLIVTDLADLSQQRIREPQTLINLNQSIPAPWSTFYNFSMFKITWPMPMKIL